MQFDVDIDLADRSLLLEHIKHTTAILDNGTKHNSGVYITECPHDPLTNLASFPYKKMEDLGYFKIDFLNNHTYKNVKNPAHLDELLAKEPMWELLQYEECVDNLPHINGHFKEIKQLREPIDSIEKLAAFIAMIRPGKRHLIGLSWKEVFQSIWDGDDSNGYIFKKSHSLSYSLSIVIAMHILETTNQ